MFNFLRKKSGQEGFKMIVIKLPLYLSKSDAANLIFDQETQEMKSPAAHSYVTSRSHVTTCFEQTTVSLLLSRETRLAIATIPSPKHNTAAEKQDSGWLQGGREEGGGKEVLVLEAKSVQNRSWISEFTTTSSHRKQVGEHL